MAIIHKSCGFVVFRENEGVNEYLLLHYPEGHWDYAKGHVEEDENELETAKRELEEETGISDIEVVSGFATTISYTYQRGDDVHKKTVDFFLAKSLETDVRLSHEHHDFVWLPFDQALEKLTFDNAKDVLIAAEAFLKSLYDN